MGMTMPGGIATILQILLGLGAMVLCFTGAGAEVLRREEEPQVGNKSR